VGVLGPRQRTENLLDELSKRGVRPSPAELRRLHGPVGIDIGSETPEEIALAALAEIRAVLSGRGGGFLRDRDAPLHEWPP
jgi:xanthine/CO dehydrogenase XdhC/CoxF family maturation factor